MSIAFTQHSDGSVTADSFPAVVEMTAELMARAEPSLLLVRWVGLPVMILGVPYVVERFNHTTQTATLRRLA